MNEGYTEVKILTAEDSNVCDLCLRYAYEFNDNEQIIFENRGEERTHNISKLIKGEQFPPFHPLCRCTYLSVWENKGKPLEEPFIVNLTPLKFLDLDHEINLPDGKPKIRWTKESLKEQLSNFTDSEKELNIIVDEVMKYMVTIGNRNEESLSAMDKSYNMVCTQHSLGELSGVNLCSEGKKAAKKKGLLFVIHNHPSNNPLQSHEDLIGFSQYNVKYNFVFTENQGLFVLKNNSADSYDIQMGWNDIFQRMKEHYKVNNSKSYDEEYKKFYLGMISRKKLKANIQKKVIKHMKENLSVSIDTYEECLSKYGVEVIRIKP